jgi:hypothetical protein
MTTMAAWWFHVRMSVFKWLYVPTREERPDATTDAVLAKLDRRTTAGGHLRGLSSEAGGLAADSGAKRYTASDVVRALQFYALELQGRCPHCGFRAQVDGWSECLDDDGMIKH